MAINGKIVTLFVPVYSPGDAMVELTRQILASSADWLDIKVVANGSPPAVLAMLERSRIPYLHLPENVGYGGAVQSTIGTAGTPYIAWMPGNLKIAVADFEEKVSPLIADGPNAVRAAKGLRIGRSNRDLWQTRMLSTTQSFLAGTTLRDGGAPPTIVARDCVPLIVGGPRGYGYDHWVLWRLLTNNIEVQRFPIRYVPHPSSPSTWNRSIGALLRMFVHLNRAVLRW